MKIRIIIYGINDYREMIVMQLHSNCKVIGYSDNNLKITEFDYIPFYPPESLSNIKCDYILISYTEDKEINAARKILFENNISFSKIIIYKNFSNVLWNNPVGFFLKKIGGGVEQLIFGMSHARNDIYVSKLSHRTYSFASPSLDIFFHNRYTRLLNSNSFDLKKVSRIIIELPYYAFNYDLSAHKKFILSKMNYFDDIDDYHNYGKTEEEINHILEFKRFKLLFGRDMYAYDMIHELSYAEFERVGYLHKIYRAIKKNIECIKNINAVWKNIFDATIQENKKLFFELLENIDKDIDIVILICPFNPVFRLAHKRDISAMKEKFYSILSEVSRDIKVIDLFDDSPTNSSCDFIDECHMTRNAAYSWTKYLDEKLGRVERYNESVNLKFRNGK